MSRGGPRRPANALAEALEHMLARATGALRAPAGAPSKPSGLVPEKGEERKTYWSAFFQATVHEAFGGINPGIQEWESHYRRISKHLEEADKSLPPPAGTASGATGFEEIIYAAFQFWNADGQRVTAFALNRRSEAFSHLLGPTGSQKPQMDLQQAWWNRWLTMDAFNRRPTDGRRLRSIGNFVVDRADRDPTNRHIFHLRLGTGRNWSRFRNFLKAVPGAPLTALPSTKKELGDELAMLCAAIEPHEDILETLDLPQHFVRSLFLTPLHLDAEKFPGSDGKTLWSLLGHGQPREQAAILEVVVSNAPAAKALWDSPVGITAQKYLGCYLYWNYFRNPQKRWSPSATDLKAMLVNNLAICITSLIRNDLDKGRKVVIYPQHQYCIPIWNNSTSYLYIATSVAKKASEILAFRAFAERLFYLSWTVDSNKKLEEDHKLLLSQATTNARAAILARNFSHSIGSHVLASPRFAQSLNPIYDIAEKAQRLARDALRKAKAERKIGNLEPLVEEPFAQLTERDVKDPRQLQSFLTFLQARFDYIAGSISDRRHIPNACLFLRDVLEPFLSQTVYLDHFVKDLGWSVLDIEVLVHILREVPERLSTVEFSYSKDSLGLPRLKKLPVRGHESEVVVALPTSMSGRHAFYSFMENFIRNGLKYSSGEKKSDSRYRIAMCWMEKEDGLSFFIWDNKSGSEEADRTIREFLKEDLVDPETLMLKGRGLGIKEMRLSALALTGASWSLRAPCLRLSAIPQPVAAIEEDAARNHAPVYSFECRKPVYLAFLGPTRRAEFLRSAPEIGEIIAMGARVLALDGNRLLRDASVLEAVLKNRERLPYRTFAVCSDDVEANLLGQHVFQITAGKGRLPIVVDADFMRAILDFASQEAVAAAGDVPGMSWDEKATIRALELWLLAWKGPPPGGSGWHLAIGLDRAVDPATSAWGKYLCLNREAPGAETWDSRLASVLVKTDKGQKIFRSRSCDTQFLSAAEGENQQYWNDEQDAGWHDKRAIVIDNHRKSFAGVFARGDRLGGPFARFYLELEGSENPELYDALAEPPADAFNFSIFILELLESSLFTVVVIDERLEQLLKVWRERKLSFGIQNFERAGIFPAALQVQSAHHGSHMIGTVWHAHDKPKAGAPVEGNRVVTLVADSNGSWDGKLGMLADEQCDAIILHEGLLDVVFSSFPGLSADCVFQQLSNSGMRVVTTSGRGSGSRYATSGSLFLEASALQSSLIAAQDKLALFRYVSNSVTVTGGGGN